MSARGSLTHQKSEYHEGVEEEDEVEPLLKYNRIGNDLKNVLNDDPASCLSVHEKYLALGSHKGSIHIFDHEGNRSFNKKFVPHEITVNQISIDDDGEYIASCGDDGKVVVHGLLETAHELNLSFPGPVKAVAINPMFSKKSRQLATGHDKLVLQEKVSGFFGTSNQTNIIHQGEGLVRCIKWCGNYIAWANDKGVKVYDTLNKQRISHIQFGFGDKFRERQDLYKCSMCWQDESTLLIAWGNEIKICKLVPRYPPPVQAHVPKICVNITKQFTAPFFVMGIAPHSGGDIVVLTYTESEVKTHDREIQNPRPHVRLIEPGLDCYTEKANDALGIISYEKYRPNLYALEWVRNEDTYFIVSPYDVLVAKPRTEDDHVAWLIKHKMFEEALKVVLEKSSEVKQHSFEAIGHMYLDHLCDVEQFEEAAKRSVGILKADKEAWENLFHKFRNNGQAKVIASYLPRENPTLDPAIYELVLYEFLRANVKSFQQLLKTWDSTIYSASVIINAILDHIQNGPPLSPEEKHTLYECLAVLYTNQHNYAEALTVYLELKHDDIFPFINKHNLFASIHNKIDQLMEFNTEKTLNLLMRNLESIAPHKIVTQLEKTPEYQFKYLNELWNKHPHETTSYHTKMVYLYTEFDRRNLLTFLKKADGYDQTAAMQFCDKRDLMEEKIYLLGKMGNHRQALHLIMKELKRVDTAIQFCQEHNYESLWEELITYSLDKPAFITVLLKNVGSHIDPLLVIQRIKEGMEIPDLRNSLVKILHDYNLQMSLREDCQKILLTDIHHLLERRIRDSRKAFLVEDSSKCGACHSLLLSRDLRCAQDVCVFYCNHSFHKDCLPLANVDLCPVCNAQKRGPGKFQL